MPLLHSEKMISNRAVAAAFLVVLSALYHLNDVDFIKRSFYPNSDSIGGSHNFQTTYTLSQNFTVDILSVASVNRLDLVSAQRRTFASHKSVRNFFNVTEIDDHDPTCHKKMAREDVRKISTFCKNRQNSPGMSPLMFFLRLNYARIEWLENKTNPVGWMCAQQRPISGLVKAFNHYKETRQQLPNYFIIMDDDSYYNMETFQQQFQNSIESTKLPVVAGCLVQTIMGPRKTNFTFPFGGFGTIFSKGSLSYLSHPIICINLGNGSFPMIATHDNSEEICSQIVENVAGELQYFENGMSLIDLMYKYVNAERYRNVDNWTSGFCMHSDWVIGFFVNFYNVSQHMSKTRSIIILDMQE